MTLMSEWKFPRRQGWCSACELAFVEGERYVSVLSIRGDNLLREDACSACWSKREAHDDLFFWFTSQRSNRKRLHLDLATLEQLFVQLEGRAERKVREMRYVLCLLLMRKRRLKLDRVERGGDPNEGESMIVHRPRRKEALRVFVFDFTPERTDELRTELLEVFDGADGVAWPSGSADDSNRTVASPDALPVQDSELGLDVAR